jgi:hypothetical protein
MNDQIQLFLWIWSKTAQIEQIVEKHTNSPSVLYNQPQKGYMVFRATFNNISVVS